MAWQESDTILSFRDEARANNYPLVDTATWISDSQVLFPKSLILDINLVAISAVGIVGLTSVAAASRVLTITFADSKNKFLATVVVAVSNTATTGEYEQPIYDSIGRKLGVAIIDVASAKTVVDTIQTKHNFDVLSHAIVPSRCAILDPDYERLVIVDGVSFFGRIPLIAAGVATLHTGELSMVGRSFTNMTDVKWKARRRSLTKLNGVTGKIAQGAILQNTADGTQDALRVSVRDGGIHFSLAGLDNSTTTG